jgi:hypothetical protein
MDKEHSTILMVQNTKVNGKITLSMVMEFLLLKMEQHTLDHLKMIVW